MQTTLNWSLASPAGRGNAPLTRPSATLSPPAGRGKTRPSPGLRPLSPRTARGNAPLTRPSVHPERGRGATLSPPAGRRKIRPSPGLLRYPFPCPSRAHGGQPGTRAENREQGVKKTQEMLPLSATLSHERRMSPKSGNPTRHCTCAKDCRLCRGPGQHAQKTHAVYSGLYSAE